MNTSHSPAQPATEPPVDTASYSLDQLRRMTTVELRDQASWNTNHLVRTRAEIELGKRTAAMPRRLAR